MTCCIWWLPKTIWSRNLFSPCVSTCRQACLFPASVCSRWPSCCDMILQLSNSLHHLFRAIKASWNDLVISWIKAQDYMYVVLRISCEYTSTYRLNNAKEYWVSMNFLYNAATPLFFYNLFHYYMQSKLFLLLTLIYRLVPPSVLYSQWWGQMNQCYELGWRINLSWFFFFWFVKYTLVITITNNISCDIQITLGWQAYVYGLVQDLTILKAHVTVF